MLLLSLLLAVSPVRASEFFEGRGFYLGDVHVHTGASADGGASDMGSCEGDCGAVEALVDTARINGLDFIGVVDHVNHITVAYDDYRSVNQILRDGNDPLGGFVTLLGAEVHFALYSGDLGHKSLLLFGTNGQLENLDATDVQPIPDSTSTVIDDCSDIATYMAGVRAALGDALLLPHHPATVKPMATDWDCHDMDWGPAVEIYSEHGNNDRMDTDWDGLWSDTEATGTVFHALSAAGYRYRLGIVGGTDSHDTRPGSVCDLDPVLAHQPYGGGLTVVVLPEEDTFDRGSIHDAIVARSTYATSGPLIPVVVDYSSGQELLGGMGEEIDLETAMDVYISVRVPKEQAAFVTQVRLRAEDGASYELFSDEGGGGWSYTLAAESLPDFAFVELGIDGATWYAEEDCNDGGDNDEERIWLSPTWFDVADEPEEDLDSDGWTVDDGDCDDEDPAVNPGADEDCDTSGDEDCDDLADGDDPDCTDSGPPVDSPPETGDSSDSSDSSDSVPDSDTDTGGAQPGNRCDDCSSAPAGAALWTLAALALLNLRRRLRASVKGPHVCP